MCGRSIQIATLSSLPPRWNIIFHCYFIIILPKFKRLLLTLCCVVHLSYYRRMFPTLRCSFSGIDQIPMHGDSRLLVMMDIVPVDNKRYRYAYHRSSWLVAGKADPPSPARLYLHPDAPYTMEQLRKQVISFEKVKLTNNEMDKSGHVSTVSISYSFICH